MKGWVALFLAIVGGAIGAFATVVLIGGTLLAVLWLYVFGDDQWPAWVAVAFDVLIPVSGLGLWAIFGWLIWSRTTESDPSD